MATGRPAGVLRGQLLTARRVKTSTMAETTATISAAPNAAQKLSMSSLELSAAVSPSMAVEMTSENNPSVRTTSGSVNSRRMPPRMALTTPKRTAIHR